MFDGAEAARVGGIGGLKGVDSSPDGAQRNPGQFGRLERVPGYAALHPGYECGLTQAVTASSSSSSNSSSIGLKVESGLVDKVIGLRLP